ncbi:hypothetical protein ACTFIR_001840 [Dictyostelium discoideum]
MSKLNQSDPYQLFRSWAPQNKISIGTLNEKIWKYYDYGPKDTNNAPIIFISHGSADIYFKQFLMLCPRGHRVISIQFSPYDTLSGWCKGFERFLDRLELDKPVHLFGSSLGGYLAQCFHQSKPSRVLSLILNNTFSDTQYFYDNSIGSSLFSLLPEFLLKKIILNNFPSGLLDNETREAVDFMVDQLETLNQNELASRLTLNCSPVSLLNPSGGLMDNITIIDCLDSTIPEKLREEVYKYYPNAKTALLKSGGDFSYLSRSDELNIHIEVHLRRFENLNNNNNNNNKDIKNNNQKQEVKIDQINNNKNNNNKNNVNIIENNDNNNDIERQNRISTTTISKNVSEATGKLNTSVFDNEDNDVFL